MMSFPTAVHLSYITFLSFLKLHMNPITGPWKTLETSGKKIEMPAL